MSLEKSLKRNTISSREGKNRSSVCPTNLWDRFFNSACSLLSTRSVPLWFWIVCGVVVLVFAILPGLGITFAINASPSIDSRVFLVIEGIEPRCGGLGVFYFNVPDNPYWKEGTRFVKRFIGCPGDVLQVRERDFYVNGRLVGTARETDSHGIPVSHFTWNGKIPEGHYFVMGDSPRSYDSRYWGFVKKEWIAGRAYPLF